MQLTQEQMNELAILKGKDEEELTDEEAARLTELEALDEDLQDFDKAFDEATAEDDPDSGDSGDKEDKEDQDGDDEGDTQKPDSDKQDNSLIVTPKKDEDSDNTDLQGEVDKLTAELAKNNQRMKSWEGRITAANKRAEVAEAKVKELEESKQAKSDAQKRLDALPDDADGKKVLEDFISEFPSLREPIELMATEIAERIISERMKDIEPKLQRIDDVDRRVTEKEDDAHFAQIREAHPDFETVRFDPKFQEFIQVQPSWIQEGMIRVAKEGEPSEVIELLDAYKKSIGQNSSNADDDDADPNKDKEEKEKAKKKKAEKLLAVDGSTGNTPPRKQDVKIVKQDDFDAAWDEAEKSDR